MQLPSTHQINDEVLFTPMYRHQESLGISSEELNGRIVAIKFTQAKTLYDIYSPIWGKLFEEVDSVNVKQNV